MGKRWKVSNTERSRLRLFILFAYYDFATGVVQRSTNIMNFFGGGEAAKPAGPDPLFAGVFIVFRGRPRKSRWDVGLLYGCGDTE